MNPLINPITAIVLVYALAVILSRVDWRGQTQDLRELFKGKERTK